MSHKNVKAGRLLSKFIRQIAEETEFVKGDSGEDDRMVSKAELLARKMWRIALGYDELVLTEEGSKTIVHPPDLKMATVVMDRMEGRCGTAVEDEVTRPTTAAKITEQGKKRIAAIGGLDDGDVDSGNA
jgi:hypothetical protein